MRTINKIGNKVFALLSSVVVGHLISDSLCGTKALRRSDWASIQEHADGLSKRDPFGDHTLLFGSVMLGLPVIEIPIHYHARTYGDTNISRFSDGWKLFKLIMYAFWRIRIRKETICERHLITGITGQDGRYLADLLLEKGYEVHGTVRRVSYPYPFEIDKRVHLHTADIGDQASLIATVYEACPDEIYNLAAMSDVQDSFGVPEYTGDINGLGFTRIVAASIANGGQARIYQASTSEMFGSAPPPQNESTPFNPSFTVRRI